MLGAGTSASPWQVADYDDLKKVGRGYDAGDDETYALSDHYLQTADIDASASQTENGSGDPVVYAGFDPIPSVFSGVYDGGGYKISDLFINRPTIRAGLFANANTPSTFRGIHLRDVDITGGTTSGTGGLVGTVVSATIEDCSVTGSVVMSSTGRWCGGLVGSIIAGTVRRCWVDATVAAGNRGTGIVFGRTDGTVTVEDCFAYGTNTGQDNLKGGFVGSISDNGLTISDCGVAVNMSGTGSPFSGATDAGTVLTDCFYDSTIANGGAAETSTATAKTTTEMKDIDTYTTGGPTWDMVLESLHDGDIDTAVWFIDDGVDYPRLWFEYEAAAGDTDALTGADLTSGTPTLDTPTIEQTHAISGADLTSGTPTLDAPTIGQVHSISGADLTSGTPTLDTPTLAEGTDNLTGADITAGTPALDAPTIAQAHVLTGADLTSGAPTLDTPTLVSVAGMDALTGADLTSGTPTIDAPTLGQVHILTGTGILGGVSIDSPALGQAHILTGGDLTAGVPTISAPIMDAATYNELYEIAVEWSQDLQIKAAWSSALEIAAKWEAQ